MRIPTFPRFARSLGAAGLLGFLAACAGGLSAPSSWTPPPPTSAPAIAQFATASTSGITAGQQATLSWQVAGATSLAIDPGVGAVTGSSVQVSPLKTTTYTLTATNALGSATAACTVIVNPPGEGAVSIIANLPAAGPVDGTGTEARFNGPGAAAVDGAGDVYVLDEGGQAIRKVTAAGVVSTLASSLSPAASGLAAGADGTLYFAQGAAVMRLAPGGAAQVVAGSVDQAGYADGNGPAAQFNLPTGLAVDAAGNVYVSDTGNELIRVIRTTGDVSTLAGTAGQSGNADGLGAGAQFASPGALAVDGSGEIYVVDAGNASLRKVDAVGSVTTVATGVSLPGGLAAGSGGILYGGGATAVLAFDLSSGQSTALAGTADATGYQDGSGSAARFGALTGLALAASGTLYAVDGGNGALRAVTAEGLVSTLAGAPAGTQAAGTGGLVVDGSGDILVASASVNAVLKVTAAGAITVFAGQERQGGSADGTGTQARFGEPSGLALDASGNLYAADRTNQTLRKISSQGLVTTVAGAVGAAGAQDGAQATFNGPAGLAADAAGDVYIADAGNDTIRKLAPDGTVTTLAGAAGQAGSQDGTGAAARLSAPKALAMDAKGVLYVADSGNGAIRAIAPSGAVTTLAFTLDGATAGAGATLTAPAALAVDASGNLYAIDHLGSRILKIVPATGLASWVPLAAGSPALTFDALAVAGGSLYASGFAGGKPVLARISGI